MNFSSQRFQIIAPITARENVAPGHFQIALSAPAIAASARAGQFVHILPREGDTAAPLLRRAFSIMAARKDEIELLFRVEGSGTAFIAQQRVGETLDVIGPLGQPFDLSLFHVKQPLPQDLAPILVGGGVGVPPMVFVAETLKKLGLSPLMLIGARSAEDVLGASMFRELGVETRVATDDGSAGHAGRVTEILEAELDRCAATSQKQAVVYACGPWPMLRAVADLAERLNVRCQVSMEENMPCGIGVCNGCVVTMKAGEERRGDFARAEVQGLDYGRYQRVCVSGPALWADQVDWEAV